MIRRVLPFLFGLVLLLASGFALWTWFRPYDWHPDRDARCEIVQAQVTKDRSYYWLELRLKMNPIMLHDFTQKILLETVTQARLEAANSTFTGIETQAVTDIWLKFWIEPKDLAGPMTLHINEGQLSIKIRNTLPELGVSGVRTFSTNQW
jgi:hypothetical protein